MEVQHELELRLGRMQGPGEMSLLDWFAGQALTRSGINAADAYEIAIAMIASRHEAIHRIRAELVKAEGK